MAYLDNVTHRDYYEGRKFGSYQFCTLDDIINQFMAVYIGEDKIIPRAKRADVAFHAKRALAELSFDTFKSVKAHQIDLPPNLTMLLPHDYVNYTKLSWTDSSGIKHPLYPTKHTSNPFQIRQDDSGQYVFDPDIEMVVNNLFEDSLTRPWFWVGNKAWTHPITRNIPDPNVVPQTTPPTTMAVNTGFDGVEKGTTLSASTGVALFKHSSHGYMGQGHTGYGKAVMLYQEIDVTGIDYLDVVATATTEAAKTTTWNLTGNSVKFTTSDGTTGTDLTIGGIEGFWDGYESVIDAYNIATGGSHVATLLSSDTNSALFDDVPATTIRMGLCSTITEEMKDPDAKLIDTSYVAYPTIGTDANGNPIHDFNSPTTYGQPMTVLNSTEVFDLVDTNGDRSYKEWTSGIDNNTEKEIGAVNVKDYDTVYFIAVSLAPFQGHAYTGELGVLTTTTTLDNISVKTTGANVLRSPYGNEENSSTWKNYKSNTPSENNTDDYQDDTYWPNLGSRYGIEPHHAQTNGSFFIDDRLGRIHFSSNISGKTVILDYISDSLGTESEMKVHKFAEEAMYKHILCDVLSAMRGIPAGSLRYYKKNKFSAIRQAKLRLSNIKLEELTQILRGKSKQIKH